MTSFYFFAGLPSLCKDAAEGIPLAKLPWASEFINIFSFFVSFDLLMFYHHINIFFLFSVVTIFVSNHVNFNLTFIFFSSNIKFNDLFLYLTEFGKKLNEKCLCFVTKIIIIILIRFL